MAFNKSTPDRRTTRRRFLKKAGWAAGGAIAAPAFVRGQLGDAADLDSRLFPLGVASGEPNASGFVIWTRLAPYPLEGGGGLGPRIVSVAWEVAADPGMRTILQSGTVLATPENGHNVKVVVRNLVGGPWFWYRFRALGETSRTGRSRIFPGVNSVANQLRFAVVSCQNYQSGYYAAYRDMAQQDLDCVVHTGDYIYEEGPSSNPLVPGRVHDGNVPTLTTVGEYRNRYALYRLDENLRNAHARFPFIVTWDDHEVQDNYAGDQAREDLADGRFLERRANAYKVYFESMPLRPEQRPDGPNLPLFRQLRFGNLAAIHVLDTRQFRTNQPCGDGFGSTDPASRNLETALGQTIFCGASVNTPDATISGADQEAWLQEGLRESQTLWNLIAQQTMMMRWDIGPVGAVGFGVPLENLFNVDAWDGYPANRQRVLEFLAEVRPNNPIVLTGDIHSSWAANLLADFDDPASDVVGAEFVCSSIASTFGDDNDALVRASLSANPHIKHFNGLNRGYTICDITPERCVAEIRDVADVFDPGSSVAPAASFRLDAGFNAPDNGGEALQNL